MHDGTVCLDSMNIGCSMEEVPESHGSTRTEKTPGEFSTPGGVCGRWSEGEKVKRKVVSPLRCLTVRDMTY